MLPVTKLSIDMFLGTSDFPGGVSSAILFSSASYAAAIFAGSHLANLCQ